MAYTLGGIATINRTEAVLWTASKNPEVLEIEGYRAYALRPDGKYQRVYLAFQESGWVDGENQGAWGTSNFDSKEAALAAARQAYRHFNR